MPLASAKSRCPVSASAEDEENGEAPGRLLGALRLESLTRPSKPKVCG